MADHPILFSAPMIRALLAGTKTQTRRVVKPLTKRHPIQNLAIDGTDRHDSPYSGRHNDPACWGFVGAEDGADMALADWIPVLCPYAGAGDLLWVRETCRAHEVTDAEAESNAWNLMDRLDSERPCYGLDGIVFAADNQFEPIQNTREASDLWSDVNAYRSKRGATVPPIHMPRWASRLTLRITDVRVQRLQDISVEDAEDEGCKAPRERVMAMGCAASPTLFFELWDSINGAGAAAANPWVWALTFEVIKANIDAVPK